MRREVSLGEGMQESQDTEVTLGTGRLLALFFGLVVICALFFSVGYSLGRKTTQVGTIAPAPSPIATPAGEKPTALKAQNKTDCTTPKNCPTQSAAQPGSTSDELTFYKSVEGKDAKTQLDQPAPNPPTVFSSKSADTKPADAKAPEIDQPASLAPGYMVQVAAVTKQEDADALVAALRKKQYPVFSSTIAGDKLFHVQVGPFSDQKQADDMKAKLVSDGYNPIVKR
jgi:cell division septation protein DedD